MMNRYNTARTVLLALGWLLISCIATAQDPHFSQINGAPVLLNPAMVGVYEGQFRVAFNYRDQWRAFFEDVPYKTLGASFDMRTYARNNDYFAFGASVMSDQAGASRYTQTQGHLSMAYLKQVAGGRGRRDVQYLVVGGQLGFGQNNINWNTLRWSTQFDGDGYDASIPSGEEPGLQGQAYSDLNAGILWYGLFGNQRSLHLGAAMHHINTPNISLYDGVRESLYRRYTVHGGSEVFLSREATLLPGFRFISQGPSYEVNFGTNIRFTTRDFRDVALRVGLWGRMVNSITTIDTDAIMVVGALEWDRWMLGMSYDFTVSDLRQVNDSRGAFEMSLIYIHPQPRRGGIFCPAF